MGDQIIYQIKSIKILAYQNKLINKQNKPFYLPFVILFTLEE